MVTPAAHAHEHGGAAALFERGAMPVSISAIICGFTPRKMRSASFAIISLPLTAAPMAPSERLCLCLGAVGKQHLRLAAFRGGARQCAAHIACADKTDLHVAFPLFASTGGQMTFTGVIFSPIVIHSCPTVEKNFCRFVIFLQYVPFLPLFPAGGSKIQVKTRRNARAKKQRLRLQINKKGEAGKKPVSLCR